MLMMSKNQRLSRGMLAGIPIPEREDVTDRWKGIEHATLAETLSGSLEQRGLEIKQEDWCVNKDGADLFGCLILRGEGLGLTGEETGTELSLGLRHSNKSKFALTFAVGARVVVCSNGLISGSFILKRRHTKGLVLEEACLELVGTFLQNAERNRLMIETLQERRLPRTTARREELVSRLIVRAAEERVMPWAMAQHVWKAYQEPSHSDFSEPTMWRVYNAFTEAVKTRKPVGQMETLSRLPKLLDVAALELPSETASESESFERVAGAGD